MATQFIVPVHKDDKQKVVASPSPSQKGIPVSQGKYIFYASVANLNIRPVDGVVLSFRNHVLRTDSAEAAEYITENFIDRQSPNLVVEMVTEEQLQERLTQKAVEAVPPNPAEGKIEKLPDQSNAKVPPAVAPVVVTPSEQAIATPAQTTGMQSSMTLNPLVKS